MIENFYCEYFSHSMNNFFVLELQSLDKMKLVPDSIKSFTMAKSFPENGAKVIMLK